MALELREQLIGDLAAGVQLVGKREHRPLGRRPDAVGCASRGRGGELRLAEADGARERGGVHAPLVLRTAQRARALDHHLAQSRLNAAVGQDAAGATEHAAEGYRLTGEGRRLLELYPPVQAWAERWARRERRAAARRKRARRPAG